MTKTDVLHEWLEAAGNDEIVIDPEDIVHESRANMWSFSPNNDELNQITVAGVERFIQKIIQYRKASLNGYKMVFYCWHDFQARQLRFSLVSESHGRIPFGCQIKKTENLSYVVEKIVNEDWFNDKYFQKCCDLEECECHLKPVPPFVLSVFATYLNSQGPNMALNPDGFAAG